MKCVYYAYSQNVDRILSTGIDPFVPEHPDIATDSRYLNLFSLTLLGLTKEWRNFSWRYNQTHSASWTPILIDIPDHEEVAFRECLNAGKLEEDFENMTVGR